MTPSRELATRACRSCGCTDDRACVREATVLDGPVEMLASVVTCSWVEDDLCSACRPGAECEGWQRPEHRVQLDERLLGRKAIQAGASA